MEISVFNRVVSELTQRWPFAHARNENEYRAELWTEARAWGPSAEAAFKRTIARFLEIGGGRPSAISVLHAVRDRPPTAQPQREVSPEERRQAVHEIERWKREQS
jgi:hypothetical protein